MRGAYIGSVFRASPSSVPELCSRELIYQIYEGTSQIQRMIVACEIIGNPAAVTQP